MSIYLLNAVFLVHFFSDTNKLTYAWVRINPFNMCDPLNFSLGIMDQT